MPAKKKTKQVRCLECQASNSIAIEDFAFVCKKCGTIHSDRVEKEKRSRIAKKKARPSVRTRSSRR